MNKIEIAAIEAMASLLGNKFTLQAQDITNHRLGYLVHFHLSNDDQYFVKVYDDNSKPIIFKALSVS